MISRSKQLLITFCLCAFLLPNLYASAFQLFEANADAVSTYGAGGAASASDVSTGYFNPAGLPYVGKKQLVFVSTLINVDTVFEGDVSGTTQVANNPVEAIPGAKHFRAQGGGVNVVPAFHFAAPLSDKLMLGLGLTVPFGLSTNWSETSPLRYAATYTSLRTFNIGPVFGYAFNEYFSIGAGLDLQYLQANFNSMVAFPASQGTGRDSKVTNCAKGFAYGANFGVIISPAKWIRAGFSYRSQIVHRVRGESKLSGDLAGGKTLSADVSANVTLPPTLLFSLYVEPHQYVALMASVYYTQWATIDNLMLENVIGPSGLINITVPQNFKNTCKFVIGTRVLLTDNIAAKAGFGFDQSPTNFKDKNVRLPDNDRYGMSFGVSYYVNSYFIFDVGYTHLFIKTSKISNTAHTGNQATIVTGRIISHADLLAAQLTLTLD